MLLLNDSVVVELVGGSNIICDFRYIKDGQEVIEDVKASPKMIPNDYKLKEKLFFWKFRTRIRRVFNPNDEV